MLLYHLSDRDAMRLSILEVLAKFAAISECVQFEENFLNGLTQ